MKDKILYLIIGMLIGAIITASIFLIIDKNKKSKDFDGNFDFKNMQDFDGKMPNGEDGEPPELPEGFDKSNFKNGERPERPDRTKDGDNSQQNKEETTKVE